MLIGLTQKVKHAKFLLGDNSSAILTSFGVAGTVTTAYLTGRATFKAARIIEQEQELRKSRMNNDGGHDIAARGVLNHELTTGTKIKLVWPLYIPPVGAGATTIACIVAANKISSRKIAALAVASGISERALQEYKEKVIEKLGDRQDRQIRDEIAQDRVKNNPANSREIIFAGTGEVLCFDMSSGRYFQSTVEEIKKAENRINYELIHFMSASLSMFYEEIGLAPTSYSDSVGWNSNHHLEVVFSTVMSADNRPCIAIDFSKQPIPNYEKVWD
jgi:hypothetical protein